MKVIWQFKMNNSIENMKSIMRGLRETSWTSFGHILCQLDVEAQMLQITKGTLQKSTSLVPEHSPDRLWHTMAPLKEKDRKESKRKEQERTGGTGNGKGSKRQEKKGRTI